MSVKAATMAMLNAMHEIAIWVLPAEVVLGIVEFLRGRTGTGAQSAVYLIVVVIRKLNNI